MVVGRNFPDLHLIATDGCFSGGGTFTKVPGPEAREWEEMYRFEVLKMLKAACRWKQRCPKFHFKKPHKFVLKRLQLLSMKYLHINGYATI